MELNLNLYNSLITIGVIQGFTFSCLLFFVKKEQRYSNQFLGLILFIFSLYLTWVIVIDLKIINNYPAVLYFPFSFILAMGPAIYFYTKSLVDASFQFRGKYWMHFSPLLLEQFIHLCNLRESVQTDTLMLNTQIFQKWSPLIQLLGILSITGYSYLSIKAIEKYQIWAENQHTNTSEYNVTWLKHLLIGYAFIWLMWVPYTFVDFYFYAWELSIQAYYPIYIFLTLFTLWIALEAYRRPQVILAPNLIDHGKTTSLAEEKQNIIDQAQGIKAVVEEEAYYLNPELTLVSLAEKINYSPTTLSKVINNGLQISFSDFINGYRVEEMKRRLSSSKFTHFTIEAIAYDCGFNSRATAIRTFKKFTNISPGQFRKNKLIQ